MSEQGGAIRGNTPVRLLHLDFLRAVAAFMVCTYHLSSRPELQLGRTLESLTDNGFLGFYVFFVISGFVIPLSMERVKCGFRHYVLFLWKRCVRIYPPFMASALLAVTLVWLTAGIPHHGSEAFVMPGFKCWLANLFLVAGFTGDNWLLPVYWTLAFELQFYLIVGLVYPRLGKWTRAGLMAFVFCCVAVANLVPGHTWLFFCFPYFAAGMIAYKRMTGAIPAGQFFCALAVLVPGVACAQNWLAAAVLGGSTLFCLYGRAFVWPPVVWLGTISYSWFLLHEPVGRRLVNLSLQNGHGGWVVVFSALSVTIVVAIFFYYLIEKPAVLWSKKVRYQDLFKN